MTWPVARAAVDVLLRSKRPAVRLAFLGGEPLLAFPLARRTVEYVERGKRHDLAVGFDIVTNGVLLDDERASFLDEHGFEVDISFDGVAQAQTLRGRGTFQVLDRRLDTLKAHQPALFRDRLRIAMTVVPATVPFLAESIEYFIGKDVQHIVLSPGLTHGLDWTPDRIGELNQQFDRVFRLSLAHYERTTRVPLATFGKVRADFWLCPAPMPMCGLGTSSAVTVDVEGELYPCELCARSYQRFRTKLLRDSLGSIQTDSIVCSSLDPCLPDAAVACRKKIASAPIFTDKRRKYSSYARCTDCEFLGRCAVCPISIAHLAGNTDPDRIPDFQCAFYRVSLAYRDRFPAQQPARP